MATYTTRTSDPGQTRHKKRKVYRQRRWARARSASSEESSSFSSEESSSEEPSITGKTATEAKAKAKAALSSPDSSPARWHLSFKTKSRSPEQSSHRSGSPTPSPPRTGRGKSSFYNFTPSPDSRRYCSRSALRSVAVVKSKINTKRRSPSPTDERSSSTPGRSRRDYFSRSRTCSRTPPRFYPVKDDSSTTNSSRSLYRLSQPLDTSKKVEKYRQRYNIMVASLDNRPMPAPVTCYRYIDLPEFTRRQIEQRCYAAFSPVQAQVWPLAIEGRNVMMVSNPGSGQTLAYLLPGIRCIARHRKAGSLDGPLVLLLVATRDAAIQLQHTVETFGYPGMCSCCITGSNSRRQETTSSSSSSSPSIKKSSNYDLIVSTPTRIVHILDKINADEDDDDAPLMDLRRCLYVVLDSVDRMLNVGLKSHMIRIIQHLRPDTQLVVSSFAWSRAVQRLARTYMGDFTLVRVGSLDDSEESSPPHLSTSIEQRVRVIRESAKLEHLKEELTTIYDSSDLDPGKILIFVHRRSSVDELVTYVRVFVHCHGIHSGRPLKERDEAKHQFWRKSCNILITTDLSSCGMDLPDIRYVINYDFPESLDRYIRRLAKIDTVCTGDCVAISFFTREDERLANSLVQHLVKMEQHVEPCLRDLIRGSAEREERGRKRGREQDDEANEEANEEARARRKRMRNRRRAQLRRLNRIRKGHN